MTQAGATRRNETMLAQPAKRAVDYRGRTASPSTAVHTPYAAQHVQYTPGDESIAFVRQATQRYYDKR